MSPARNTSEQNQKMKGHIELILGPMFSGKSTELMRRLKRYKVNVLLRAWTSILLKIIIFCPRLQTTR